jgi:hypothetical protein
MLTCQKEFCSVTLFIFRHKQRLGKFHFCLLIPPAKSLFYRISIRTGLRSG